MREIKYRVWITPWGSDAEPYMQYIPDLHLHVFLGNWERGGYKDAVFQQYTGLQDKNGKEIYEGDIIEWGAKGPTEVRWISESDGYDWTGWHPTYLCGGEIVGNIFENCELLK